MDDHERDSQPSTGAPGSLRSQLRAWTRDVFVAFVLVMLGLLVLLVGNWQVLDPQVRERIEAGRAARAMHEAMVDQETALRSYLVSGDPAFLASYEAGHRAFEALVDDVDQAARGGASSRLLVDMRVAQRAWLDLWAPRAIEAGREGVEAAELSSLLTDERDLFDDYRQAHQRFLADVLAQRDAAVRRQSLAIVWTMGGTLVLALAMGWRTWRHGRRLHRSLDQPLQRLVERLDSIEQGDLSPHPPLEGPSELSRLDAGLARASSALAESRSRAAEQAAQIDAQNHNLEQVLRFAREVAGSLNLRYVVRGVTDAAAEISGRRVVVWVRRAEGDLVEALADSAGPGMEALGHEPVTLGDGLVGRTARFGRIERAGTDHTGDAARPSGEVGIPMVVGAQVIGVLQVLDPERQTPLEPSVLEVLEALAVQAAAAVASARLYERTDAMARTDALTMLPNRRQLDHDLVVEGEVSARHGRPLAVAMFDVDHFKAYNDALGHQAGDVALQGVARILADSVRSGDQVYRYGGEEILVVMRETTVEEGHALADRLRATVEHQFSAPSQPRALTVSAGVAAMPTHATAVADLVLAADRALYAAKHAGRNIVCTADTPTSLVGSD